MAAARNLYLALGTTGARSVWNNVWKHNVLIYCVRHIFFVSAITIMATMWNIEDTSDKFKLPESALVDTVYKKVSLKYIILYSSC